MSTAQTLIEQVRDGADPKALVEAERPVNTSLLNSAAGTLTFVQKGLSPDIADVEDIIAWAKDPRSRPSLRPGPAAGVVVAHIAKYIKSLSTVESVLKKVAASLPKE